MNGAKQQDLKAANHTREGGEAIRQIGRISLILAVAIMPVVQSGCGWRGASVARFTFECDGLTLVGDLHYPEGRAESTAVLLLHGSGPLGRRLVLYRELAERLCARGYLVLNLDQRAYGESDDPPRLESAGDLDFVGDAAKVADTLPQITRRSGIKRVVCVGHSFGGGVAVAAGLRSEAVAGMVSISPGRRMTERFFREGARDGLAYVRKRKSADMELATPMPIELVQPVLAAYNIEQIRGLRLPKPLLLIEGSEEPVDDLAFSRGLVATLGGPVEHVVIPGAGHYFGTSIVKTETGKAWDVVDEALLATVVDHIASWLNRHPSSAAFPDTRRPTPDTQDYEH